MQYFLLPLFLVVFSELLGNITLNKFNLSSFTFNGLFGFVLILGIYYVICFPLVALNVKFVVLLLVTLLYFLILLIFILKNHGYLKFNIKTIDFLIVLLLVGLQLYFASRNTVGSLWRYDTITYTNMISSTIYGSNINSMDYANGFGSGFYTGYSFQSYYKLASVLYYLINGICNEIHIDFFYYTQHTWMYTIVLYVFIAEMVINFIKKFNINNKWVQLIAYLFIILFMGNFYWNSEQAYLGNSFRMIMVTYCLYYLDLFFKEENNKYLIIVGIFNYANAACANSNSTLVLILTFMIFIYMPNKKNNLKILLIGSYLPLINCLFQAYKYSMTVLLFITVMYAILFVFEDKVFKILNKKKLLIIIPASLLVILSFRITHNLFDFNAFLNNWSGWSDMTWDYTDFSNLWRSVANIVYIFVILLAFIAEKESALVKMLIMTTLVFFNPFAAPVQNEYMPVFYRNYDIVINYLSLFISFKAMNDIKLKGVYRYSLYTFLIFASVYIGYEQLIYHPPGEGFDKYEGYNELLKMDDDTADALLFLKSYVVQNDLKDAKVISSIYQIRTEFPYLKTLYNRGKQFNGIDKDWDLYSIFYPEEYYGDEYGFKDVDYSKVNELLKESDYKLLILSKDKIIYENDNYLPLTYKIDEAFIPLYDNDSYTIYQIH